MPHSPGPWKIQQECVDPEWHIVTASGGRIIANVHIETGNTMDAANARLIAAAPELLAACEAYIKYADDEVGCLQMARIVDDMRAAILKAKGEPS